MLSLKYADNETLWAIEREAKKHGYKMDHNAYWVQIFTNADWDQITTERDDEYSGDALEILRDYFGEAATAQNEHIAQWGIKPSKNARKPKIYVVEYYDGRDRVEARSAQNAVNILRNFYGENCPEITAVYAELKNWK